MGKVIGITEEQQVVLELACSTMQGKIGWRRLVNATGYSRNIVSRFLALKDRSEEDPQCAEQERRDVNRVQEAEFRDNSRKLNRYMALLEAFTAEIENIDLSQYVVKHDSNPDAPVGMLQISDAHFNELVELVTNTYDFNVASQRLKLLADKTCMYLKGVGATEVVIAFTGDLINSDRRREEMLNKATNRAKACLLAVDLLKQFILHLGANFNVECAFVCGNESRIDKEHGHSEELITDNYDWIIGEILRRLLENSGIRFITHNPVEAIISINGQNVLMLHGDQIPTECVKKVQSIVGQYADQGITIDYVIFGHIHCAFLSDNFSRSSSLVGDNAYSYNQLRLVGRASQNLHLFWGDGNRDAIKIDLQNTLKTNCYNVTHEMEAYNAKSATKQKYEPVVLVHKSIV